MSTTSPEKEKMRPENSTPHSDEEGEVDERNSSPAKSLDQGSEDQRAAETSTANPPLPTEEEPPPIPVEAPPTQPVDDGWEPIWDDHAQAFYFFNRFTKVTQWENPRVPEASSQPGVPGVGNHDRIAAGQGPPPNRVGGYDPAIHGDYDPNADYAKAYEISSADNVPGAAPGTIAADMYAASGTFNRFTGKWQRADLNPENFTDEQKSRRQMNAFFDVDAAANSHDGRSLRAERANKKLSKAEVKAFKEKRREKKEEKRRAWLRD
ncbi:hypothetical protein AYL99_08496 [Fonsecaea erecta]|uniref:WW domain-containing protein n=1 Tax=Fonsecaea erecta TaxID=1367422 RepID=A0A178ZDC1_9EURO|nr:hypothetical protein AYL99_08496 [Fonsecaea erecta]OAP57758.1 hypothetical protein AYL99_08496 [Fonsecaea erecta]